VGIPGAQVSLLDANSAVLATVTADIIGFYFFPTSGVLTTGSNYTVKVTGIPKPFRRASPAFQAFTWAGSGFGLPNFVLN
jgi:hypothetical protein